ncbi:hypothetical protein NDU88_008222 [Pleurodeles waltl]|uniref:Uncharacterized protein n=1 Tax=Pleurodeles waltl TaxID=8319 RepID=A0AAV7N5R5_PLEWA|nr:hypothetical protein NDU88_008222 [Pleurodeles waltl]
MQGEGYVDEEAISVLPIDNEFCDMVDASIQQAVAAAIEPLGRKLLQLVHSFPASPNLSLQVTSALQALPASPITMTTTSEVGGGYPGSTGREKGAESCWEKERSEENEWNREKERSEEKELSEEEWNEEKE